MSLNKNKTEAMTNKSDQISVEKKAKAKKKDRVKKEDQPLVRDLFGYCQGCSADICSDPCSAENNWNLPF